MKRTFLVKFTLDDDRFCKGCPCYNYDENGFSCNLFGYYDNAPSPYAAEYEGEEVLRCAECKAKLKGWGDEKISCVGLTD